jgi:hypothetical protein
MAATALRDDETLDDGGAPGRTMQTVLDVLREHGRPMTDGELQAACNLRGGAVRPARLRLYRRGLVEPCGSGTWRLVEPERREEVQVAASSRAPRRRGLESLSLDERVATVLALLDDEEVNEVVRTRIGSRRAWRRASARAGEVRAEREQERRARRLAAMKAEQLRSPLTAFLKMRNHLKDAVEMLLGLHRLLAEDATPHRGDGGSIPRAVWPDLARNVRELVAAASSVQAVLDGAEVTAGACPVCHRPAGGAVLEYIDGVCIDVPVAGAA